jgi:hypothetical protein
MRCSDTVVGRQSDDVHFGHIAHPEPGGQPDTAGASLEARVCRLILALREDRLHLVGVQRGMELGPGGAGDTMRRPGVDIVG